MANFAGAKQTAREKCAALLESNPEILRANHTSTLLSWFGVVFSSANQFRKFATFHKAADTSGPAVDGHTACKTSEGTALKAGTEADVGAEEHREADAQFYSSKRCEKVDAFVSHCWAAKRLQKHLALLYHMNIRLATFASVLAWVLGNIGFLASVNFDVTALGGNQLLAPMLIFLPTLVFFVFFWFGQQLTCHLFGLSVWLDKLCIHQTRSDLKALGVQNLDVFVVCADRMILLWDESYFSRLWCNLEIATFCAMNGGAERVDFCPLWLAPWVLNTIMLDILSTIIFVIMLPSTQIFDEYLGPDLGLFARVIVNMVVTYLPAVLPNSISFRSKIRTTNAMIQQIEAYRLEDAQCAFESDRPLVEAQVASFFAKEGIGPGMPEDAGGEEGQEGDQRPEVKKATVGMTSAQVKEGIENFNMFMRADFKDHIKARVGSAVQLPYFISFVVFLPLIFSSTVDILGCENTDCEKTAEEMGVASVYLFEAVVTLNWVIGAFLVYPTTYPIAIKMVHACMNNVNDGALQFFLCCVCVIGGYLHLGVAEGAVVTLNSMLVKGSCWWALPVWCAVVAYLLTVNYILFVKKDSPPGANHVPQTASPKDEEMGGTSSKSDGVAAESPLLRSDVAGA